MASNRATAGSNTNPNQILVDETIYHVGGRREWLYTAIDPVTNEFPLVG